jgi:glutathione S-transferase
MSQFVVHTIVGSPYGRSVIATLIEKGADWRLEPVHPGLHRQPAHLQRHPFGRVPVLEHDGFRLYETQAILRYLDRILPHPPLTPPNPRQAARMDQIMAVMDWYFFQGVANPIVFQRVIAPRLIGATPDEAAIAEAMPRAHIVIREFAAFLGATPFMAGGALSLADLHLAPQISLLSETPEWSVFSTEHPLLTNWLARMEARPSLATTSWDALEQRLAA